MPPNYGLFVLLAAWRQVEDMEWATAAISTGSTLDAFALKDWLDNVSELRGRSEVVVLPTDVGSQGGVTDVLAVTLSSGGAVALLVNALPKWLALRRNVGSLKVKVTRQDGKPRSRSMWIRPGTVPR